MNKTIKASDIEIMSPVGSRESLVAAVQGGAGSVYFGVGRLNMRAHSSVNFTLDDLADICRYCHDHQVKTYLTVNTVIYDEELDEMRRTIDAAKANGVDALIISDQSAMDYAQRAGMEVHLSTQLNISNTESLKFYAQWADVVVLARELNLDQVKQIAVNIGKENICGPSGKLIRIEMFVHGALCMAISGKCYLSLHEYNKSANRGSCYQVCRHAYEVTDLDTGSQLKVDNAYIMSPKDLMTLPFLDKLLEAGVSVLKIEGRARPPEYVKTVTECYREAVDAVADDDFTPKRVKEWEARLRSVFNRGFWDGYYLGRRLGEWTRRYGSRATKKKNYLGRVQNYFSKIGIGEFVLQTGDLNLGDEVLITGPTTGVMQFRVSEMRVDLKNTGSALKGQVFSMPVPGVVRRSDKLFLLYEAPGED